MDKITSNEIVNNALEMGSSDIHKAIISLMFTTGLDKDDVRNITINDLVKAADMCFKDDEPHNIDVLTNKNGEGMFLCWTFEKDPNTKLYSAARPPPGILSNILSIMGNIIISMI